jgi:hypothetical protein
MTYPEMREFFLERGLRFACMTEHIEYLEQADIDRIVEDCRANSDAEFVFVPGIEMDCFYIYFVGVERCDVDFSSNKTIFESLYPNAAMCVFSHPIKAKFTYPDWLMEICDAVEILNCKHDGKHYFRPQSERLYQRVLGKRPQAVAWAGMDFHGPKDYNDIRLALTEKGSLSESFIVDSLRNGRFEVVKGREALRDYGLLRRTAARGRIHAMDFSHNIHSLMTQSGFKVPGGVKRLIRKLMEGS